MKKIIYLLAILVITFSSCNPLEDIHNEIDAIPDAPNVGSFVYTLVDADYTALNLNFGNFSNEADAKEKLPGFLATKYALYGEGSDANVTFKIYAPKFDEKSLKIYEVTRQDYTDNGHRFGNFDNNIISFFDKRVKTGMTIVDRSPMDEVFLNETRSASNRDSYSVRSLKNNISNLRDVDNFVLLKKDSIFMKLDISSSERFSFKGKSK